MPIFSKPLRVHFSQDKKLHQSLRNILGFYPGNIALYKSAFRHSSAASHIKDGIKDSNERLEFLGDSVIGTVVADYLFKKFPFKDEGFLTKMRSKMGLRSFIEAGKERNAMPSSINGDAYEALIGAIYLDKGFEFAQQFLLTRIINVHIDMDEVETKEVDFKSKFIEWAQKEKKDYRFETAVDGNAVSDKLFTIQLIVDDKILGSAQHFSKKRAEQLAAEVACIALEL